jgi:glyceraldehyde-3-phosphate dehydrogenase/erythrose-4-phosphate dehydrogenase
MKIKVAINGYGRIGRMMLRAHLQERHEFVRCEFRDFGRIPLVSKIEVILYVTAKKKTRSSFLLKT